MATSSSELCQAFLDAQGVPAGPDDALGVALSAAVEAGVAAWPELAVEPTRFAAFLGHRIPSDVPAAEAVRRRAVAELYLTHACLAGAPRALELFEEQYLKELPNMLARKRIDREVANDTVQQLRTKLLLGERPLLLAYSGTGELRGWLRVTALRAAIRAQRKRGTDRSEDGELAAAALDVDIQYQRKLYQEEFRGAFADALASLTVRQRNLLKHSVLHGATSDDLGALYQVHRATAARWLAEARDRLAAETQRRMIAKLAIDRAQYASILRLIHSQLDVSVERLLRTDHGT